MNNNLITKSNEIIQNKKNNSTYLQNQILVTLIANKMSNYEEDKIDMDFSLSKNELLNMLHKGNGGRQYDTIGSELQKFNQTCILTWDESYEREDGTITKRTRSLPFFKDLSYYHDTEMVEAEWNPEILPYLRALKSCYTTYPLEEYMKLRSNHTQNLYELMKSYLGQGYITLSIDNLKEKLGCNKQKTYKDFKRFNEFILKKDIKEINEKTDINVAITKRIKDTDGKTVKSLLFEIKSKNIKRAWLNEFPTVLLTETEYNKLFHGDLSVPLVKQCMYKLHQYLTEHPEKTIRNHYRKIMEYYNAWKNESQWEQLTLGRKQVQQPIRQYGTISRKPSYDLEQIKQNTHNNTEIKY